MVTQDGKAGARFCGNFSGAGNLRGMLISDISRNFLSLATQMTDSEKESENEKESSFCCQGFYCSIPLPDGLEKLAFD